MKVLAKRFGREAQGRTEQSKCEQHVFVADTGTLPHLSTRVYDKNVLRYDAGPTTVANPPKQLRRTLRRG
jgi:hypothetical protein